MSPPTASVLLHQLASQKGRPITVTFQVTERCNYDCVHCFQDHEGKDELTTDEVMRILEELAEAGVFFLTLMGGEFFMRRDADEILAKARELGFQITLKTTGHFIHDRRADFIATLRPITVDLSVYAATSHGHEQITEQKGSFERTIAAAQRLVDRGVRVVLNTPVTEGTAGEVAALENLATSLGAEISFDSVITPKTNGSDNPLELRMRWRTLRSFFADHNSLVGRELVASYADPANREPLPADESSPCRAGEAGVGITPHGKVWPCMVLPVECGDLRRQSFESVWSESQALDEVRNLLWASLEECASCELRRFCRRCHANALTEHGEIRGPSLEACRQAVATRDALREQGVLPTDDTVLPPTWDRVGTNGQHAPSGKAVRASGLRVLP